MPLSEAEELELLELEDAEASYKAASKKDAAFNTNAPYKQKIYSVSPKSREETMATIEQYAPELLQENWPYDAYYNQAKALRKANLHEELLKHFGIPEDLQQSYSVERLQLMNAAQAQGFNPFEMPETPSGTSAFLSSAAKAIPGAATVAEIAAPDLNFLKKEAQKPEEESLQNETLQFLKDYSPEVYQRIRQNDASLTNDEYRDAYNQAYRRYRDYAALTSPKAGFAGEMLGNIGLEKGLGKVFGARTQTPTFQATLGAAQGLEAGNTLDEKLGAALMGGLSGGVSAGLAKKFFGEVSGPKMSGLLDEKQFKSATKARAAFEEASPEVTNLRLQRAEEARAAILAENDAAIKKLNDDIQKQEKLLKKAKADVRTQDAADAEIRLRQKEAELAQLEKARENNDYLMQSEINRFKQEQDLAQAVYTKQSEKAQQDALTLSRDVEEEANRTAVKLAEEELGVPVGKQVLAQKQKTAFQVGETGKIPATKKSLLSPEQQLDLETQKQAAEIDKLYRQRKGAIGKIAQNLYERAQFVNPAAIEERVTAGTLSREDADVLLKNQREAVNRIHELFIEEVDAIRAAEKEGISLAEYKGKQQYDKKIAAAEARLRALENENQKISKDAQLPGFDFSKYKSYLDNSRSNLEKAGLLPPRAEIDRLAEAIKANRRGELLSLNPRLRRMEVDLEDTQKKAASFVPPKLLGEPELRAKAQKTYLPEGEAPSGFPAKDIKRLEQIRQTGVPVSELGPRIKSLQEQRQLLQERTQQSLPEDVVTEEAIKKLMSPEFEKYRQGSGVTSKRFELPDLEKQRSEQESQRAKTAAKPVAPTDEPMPSQQEIADYLKTINRPSTEKAAQAAVTKPPATVFGKPIPFTGSQPEFARTTSLEQYETLLGKEKVAKSRLMTPVRQQDAQIAMDLLLNELAFPEAVNYATEAGEETYSKNKTKLDEYLKSYLQQK